MYTKLNQLVAKFASRYGLKEELRSVAFFGNRTIATDSFRLLEVSAKPDKDGNLPEAHEPKLIIADAVKKLKLKKSDELTLSDIEQQTGITPNPHINYPEVDILINNAASYEDSTELTVNGRLLGELLVAMSKGNAVEAVTLRVPNGPGRPIYVYTKLGEQKMRGLCMPMNK